ncbi:hypothetical protein NEMBOFW57_005077 [Staphylotrichum longicolle]|uniref:Uncharacterized protein n=1 Tax=Staphylotrichum longicolle TaxID=669026 RepID=A0AAD4HZB4_9PEZI|nr:hypothetical protein NEMBOFW57_005077 [Staphylotrichum longicolle]
MKLDKTDEKLWIFHIHAFCAGRTLLPGNYWFDQVAAIAAKDPCARHALLAFSTAYVLDFQPTEAMRLRANDHYRNAVRLLGQALQQQETYRAGSEDGIVAAMILIYSNDIVNWESRRPKDQQPLWREGARAARRILDHSDPGYRYWAPGNVQSSRARIGNANWVAYTDICAQPVTPLTEESTQNLFPWLLEGSKEEVHKIHDATGVCSKLLHMFSQVTYFAALLKKDPESTVVPPAAVRLREKLKNFRQWSDLSLGYPSVEELFDSCNLDDNGQPRSHPHVVRSLKVLIRCIERMPCTGPLFTSQSPFFPVFLMAIASVRPEERKVSRDWFEVVLSGAQCRSERQETQFLIRIVQSVPPVWVAIKKLWEWLDNELVEEPYDEDQPIGQRRAWWEEMVAKLVEESGVLSLV